MNRIAANQKNARLPDEAPAATLSAPARIRTAINRAAGALAPRAVGLGMLKLTPGT